MINNCTFAGRVSWVGDIRYTPRGDALLEFGFVVNPRKRKDGKEGEPLWIKCVLYGKRAETLGQFLVKGTEAAIMGAIWPSTYEKDGAKTTQLMMHSPTFEFIGHRPENAPPVPPPQRRPKRQVVESDEPVEPDVPEGDLPF